MRVHTFACVSVFVNICVRVCTCVCVCVCVCVCYSFCNHADDDDEEVGSGCSELVRRHVRAPYLFFSEQTENKDAVAVTVRWLETNLIFGRRMDELR